MTTTTASAAPHSTGATVDATTSPVRSWCADGREDPLTGLIAFPDLHAKLPQHLADRLLAGGLVGLAIGDVDGLKAHVEQANTDPAYYGHLAGNRVMERLGEATRVWFHTQLVGDGCSATFGGDEVIVAAAIDDPSDFLNAIADLRDQLGQALPVPVSFALALVAPAHLPADRSSSTWAHDFTDMLFAGVDKALFTGKSTARAAGTGGGSITVTEPVPAARGTQCPRLSLPKPGEQLQVVARRSAPSGRPTLLLPCAGPQGLRGVRVRVTRSGARPRTEVAVGIDGQAVLPADGPEDLVALTVEPVRTATPHSVPSDLADELLDRHLDWSALPGHEQAQLLALITESATPEIRNERIAAAVTAVEQRSSQ